MFCLAEAAQSRLCWQVSGNSLPLAQMWNSRSKDGQRHIQARNHADVQGAIRELGPPKRALQAMGHRQSFNSPRKRIRKLDLSTL